MHIQNALIENCWIIEPTRFDDSRGFFQETFKHSSIKAETGFDFDVKQVNQSRSSQGVFRGIHWADVPPGQAKYVFVSSGAVIDFIIDLRIDSPTFKRWQAVTLSAKNSTSLLIGNGVGHAFLALEDLTVVNYLCSEEYSPTRERTLSPMDDQVALPLSELKVQHGLHALKFSERDLTAPSLDRLLSEGLLPKAL